MNIDVDRVNDDGIVPYELTATVVGDWERTLLLILCRERRLSELYGINFF